MKTITNNETGEIKTFATDREFLEGVQLIYDENETGQPYPSEIYWRPENVQQAAEYIHEYCGELDLTELTPPALEEFLVRPGINIAGICSEADIPQQYLNRCRKEKKLPGEEVMKKLLPVIKKYGY